MISSIIQVLFLKIKIQPTTSEQEKKRQIIYDLLNAETKPKFSCLPYTKQRIFFFTEKDLFEEKRGVEDWTKKKKKKKTKRKLLTALATEIKKDPTTSISKHASELKAHEKTVRTAIKQDLAPLITLYRAF